MAVYKAFCDNCRYADFTDTSFTSCQNEASIANHQQLVGKKDYCWRHEFKEDTDDKPVSN